MATKIISFLFNDFSNDIRVLKENTSLQRAGFDVTLVATCGNNLPSKEVVNKVPVLRVKTNYIPILPVELLIFWIKCVLRYRKEYLFHCNDLYTLPIGAFIKLLNKKAKFVYDCHEYETEVHILNKAPLLKIIAKIVERLLIRYADAVITVSGHIAEEYVKNYGIPKPRLVLNCPNYHDYQKKDLLRLKYKISQNTKIVLYQGEYRQGRGLEEILDAFSRIENDHFAMVFLGYGNSDKIVDAAKRCKNIFIHPKVGVSEYMDYVCSADFGIHLMKNTCLNHDYALPNKLFEYLMGGIPVIVSSLTEMKKFVKEYNVGFVLEENTSQGLIDVLKRIENTDLTEIRKNVHETAKKYCWENQETNLIETYKSLI
ncbi:MAG: Glycosyltransferase [uncultured bacterium]|nr:MAG: Glycosyltransferase [uncultured bacterium]